MEEVANVFMADISNAAKLLRSMRTMKEATGFKYVDEVAINKMQKVLTDVSPASAEEVAQLDKIGGWGSKALETWRSLDKLRIA